MKTITPRLDRAVRLKVAESIGRAERHYNRKFDLPEVLFDIKGMDLAGQANSTKWLVRFNTKYFEDDEHVMLTETVPHEVAHLIANRVYGSGQGHNENWKYVMEVVMQIPPSRCHDMKIFDDNRRPYRYRCKCQYFHLAHKMHKQIQSGTRRGVHCKTCRGNLYYHPFELMIKPSHTYPYWLKGEGDLEFTVPHDLWVKLLADTEVGNALGCSRTEEAALSYRPDKLGRSPFEGEGFLVSAPQRVLMLNALAKYAALKEPDNNLLQGLKEFLSQGSTFLIMEDDDDEDCDYEGE